jgi:uncharacterized protein
MRNRFLGEVAAPPQMHRELPSCQLPFVDNGRRNLPTLPCFFHPTEVRPSKISGKGVFAVETIRSGEIILVCGGRLFSKEAVRRGEARTESLTGFDEEFYIGMPIESPSRSDEFINHSCNPNMWLTNEITVVARRTIHSGEELTIDYALWEIDENWLLPNRCNCTSAHCRKIVTGRDWRLNILRSRYGKHFLPCINLRSLEEIN